MQNQQAVQLEDVPVVSHPINRRAKTDFSAFQCPIEGFDWLEGIVPLSVLILAIYEGKSQGMHTVRNDDVIAKFLELCPSKNRAEAVKQICTLRIDGRLRPVYTGGKFNTSEHSITHDSRRYLRAFVCKKKS